MISDTAKRPDEAAMRRILDRYSDSPEGIILRLAWLEGLSRKELNELTWDQVDFETQNLLLQDRTIPLEPSVAECLQKRYEQYSAISERVIIADRGKKPMTLGELLFSVVDIDLAQGFLLAAGGKGRDGEHPQHHYQREEHGNQSFFHVHFLLLLILGNREGGSKCFPAGEKRSG